MTPQQLLALMNQRLPSNSQNQIRATDLRTVLQAVIENGAGLQPTDQVALHIYRATHFT